jgi:hypothetical protein
MKNKFYVYSFGEGSMTWAAEEGLMIHLTKPMNGFGRRLIFMWVVVRWLLWRTV